ncbi:MAG: DEAD/DEAH box helicase family protein [Candidatus Hodarchaeota archaeon]
MVKEYLKDMKFKYPWRPYQARILKELEEHLEDNKLHVVAAPGSGKTVLGLEAVHRLNKPTLVLAPSIAIKDQWVDRLVDLFLGAPDKTPRWISKNIKDPGYFTVSTYQGLHVAYTRGGDEEEDEDEKVEEEEDVGKGKKTSSSRSKKVDLIAEFKKAGIKTIVVDEAHHLRTAWWKSLTKIVEGMDNPTTLALTATPPYDVDPDEWKRYTDLCGPIDAEVNVPELVKARNLCPHQDYAYFSTPTKEEMGIINDFEKNVDEFLKKIIATKEFTSLIENHRWIKQPNENVKEILDNPALYSSMLVYMNFAEVKIPKEAIELVAGDATQIPKVNNYWMGTLLSGIFGDPRGEGKLGPEVEELRKDLHRIGAIERREVSLNLNEKVSKLLATSLSKMNSIEEIVKVEYKSLKDKLHMVILTDYIRKNMLPGKDDEEVELNKIGVVPLFETVRRLKIKGLKLGVLTGGIVFIPKDTKDLLLECMEELELEKDMVKFKPLAHDEDFLSVDFQSKADVRKVAIITEMFIKGGIHVLVGTKSLLGEGWDAPVVNSLILATFVGSFMFSNQMRGRAIRIDKNDPNKGANIWHLICVLPDKETAGDDYKLLERRFKSFVGISREKEVIENGFGRLDLPQAPIKVEDIDDLNEKTLKAALDRKAMIKRWDKVLEKSGSKQELVEKVVVDEDYAERRLKIKQGFKKSGIEDISLVLLKGLCATDIIKTRYGDIDIKVVKEEGELSAYLEGGTRKERSLFLSCLEEIIDPPENPKYLIANIKGKKLDMDSLYAVPKVIGEKKPWAQYYSDQWWDHVAKNELVYTRTKDGRLILLKARNRATYASERDRAERLSRWE